MQVHAIWGSPLIIIVVLFLLYREIEWACFVGLGVMLLLVPITGKVGKALGRLRAQIVGWTDKRTTTMSEVVNGMRVIKFYGWEVPFRCALFLFVLLLLCIVLSLVRAGVRAVDVSAICVLLTCLQLALAADHVSAAPRCPCVGLPRASCTM